MSACPPLPIRNIDALTVNYHPALSVMPVGVTLTLDVLLLVFPVSQDFVLLSQFSSLLEYSSTTNGLFVSLHSLGASLRTASQNPVSSGLRAVNSSQRA